MLIGRDDTSNDVITHSTTLRCLHSCLFLLRTDWQNSDSSVDGKPLGNWRWNSNSRDVVASCPSFSCPAPRVPQRGLSQAMFLLISMSFFCYKYISLYLSLLETGGKHQEYV